MLSIWVGTFLAKIQLTVCIVIVHILKYLSSVFLLVFFITGSLTISTFFLLNNELLTRIRIYLIYLREWLLELGLLLFVLFEPFLALI